MEDKCSFCDYPHEIMVATRARPDIRICMACARAVIGMITGRLRENERLHKKGPSSTGAF